MSNIRYQVEVEHSTGVNIRGVPDWSTVSLGWYPKGKKLIITERTTKGDTVWDKLENGQGWIPHRKGPANGYVYHTHTRLDLTGTQESNPGTNDTNKDSAGSNANGTGAQDKNPNSDYEPNKGGGLYDLPTSNHTSEYSEFEQISSSSLNRNFPKVTSNIGGVKTYDYTMDYKELETDIKSIKDNLNIPTALNSREVLQHMFFKYNRYGVAYQDFALAKTKAYVFFTRPDLNLFEDNNSSLHKQIKIDAKLYGIYKHNPIVAKSLVLNCSDKNSGEQYDHHLNLLLSNCVRSLEVVDEGIDTVETGETFSGYKMQYGKHNIKSISSNTVSFKFAESKDLLITKMHQMWVDYMSQVYRGTLKPKDDYIFKKVLDYTCDVYYFLVDGSDGETVLFWSKYYGVFPLNVPKSQFSYDDGSMVTLPEISVNYAYFLKDDLSPITLVEFNKNTGNASGGLNYLSNYIPKMGGIGKTWSGVPFIESGTSQTGANTFKLRFRK